MAFKTPARRPITGALAGALLALPGAAVAQDRPDPRALIEAVQARDTGDTQTAQLRMVLRDAQGNTRQRVMQQRFREAEGEDRRLLRFTSPADVEGTAFLSIDRESGTDEQFLYLPEMGDTRRIAGSNQAEPFMGSDFTYADLGSREVDEWRYKLLDRKEVRGHRVWRVIATPKTEAVRAQYGYKRSLLYVRPDTDMVVRAIHETTEGTTKYLDVRDIREVDGVLMGHELEMRTAKQGNIVHATLLQFSDVKIDVPLDSGALSRRALERGS